MSKRKTVLVADDPAALLDALRPDVHVPPVPTPEPG
jgi:hypothetical protein